MISKIGPRKIGNSFVVFVALAFSAGLFVPVYAQVVGATLSGTVTDQSGAVIPNARISINNIATGTTRTVTTDTAGFFSTQNLLPGAYEITVMASGFATDVHTGVTLTVGGQQVLDFTMQVGQVNQKVQVTGEAPTVQLATSDISAVVSSTTVRELPLNGRSWTDLATLQPGVAAIQTQPVYSQGVDRGNRGYGAQITVSGARPQENNYRLDGISINDYTNNAPGSVIGGDLGVDAIEEFSLLTSNYSAEYGRTSGGVVNAITRAGTNQFHGAVYEFLRNSALDARNFFDSGTIPPFRRNQFGASAGLPIRKNKLFVFGDYEGIRQNLGTTTLVTVPSVAARGGTLCSAPDTTPACTPTTITVGPSVQKYLPFWPLPTSIKPGKNGDIGIATFVGQQVTKEDFITTRVDNKFSDKDSLVAMYLSDVTPFTSPDSINAVRVGDKTNRKIATLEETHMFSSTLINSARIGFSRDDVRNNSGNSVINPLAKDPSLAAVPGQFAAQVIAPGITLLSGGLNGESHFYMAWNSFQEYDDALWTHGTHSVKFGGAVERMQYNDYRTSLSSGVFTFATLSDFLTNKPSRFQVGEFSGKPNSYNTRGTLFGLYVHDDWRARSNLTVNMGLRWEIASVPNDAHGKLATLIHPTDPTPHLGSPLFSNFTFHNFEPRLGFSWDPFHNGKTAVRGGFGVYDVLPLTYEVLGADGMFAQGGATRNPPPGSFYTGAAALLGPASKPGDFFEQRPHRNYVMQWNLNVQRELLPNVTLLLGYVGSHGVHLPVQVNDIDIVIPRRTPAGYLFPSPVGSGTKLNPKYGGVGGTLFNGNSSYHALEVGVHKAMRQGLQIQGSFTWGKAIDNSSAVRYGDQYGNSIGSLPWYDFKSVRGLSDFNVSRTLVVSGTWAVPSPKSFSGAAAWITNGWELGGIYKASDGVPFTATFGTDGDPQGLKSNDPWDFPNRLFGPGCRTAVNPRNPNNYIKTQCFAVPTAPSAAFYAANCDPTFGTFPQCFNLRGNSGRNTLIGPGTSSLDFSVFKNNHIKQISENFNVQFRAEFFNIMNHPNFAVPVTPDNTDIFDSTGTPTGVAGLLTSTTTTAREIQFALKLIW